VRLVVTTVAAVAALLLGVVLGGLLLGGETEPSDTSPEAGFARDMSVHHEQAVELAFIIRDRTDDPDIRLLAYDIINTQRAQIGMFSGWLQQWQLSQTTTRPPMEWASHDHEMSVSSYDDMPGMASDADIERLKHLSGVAAERLFLKLMIAHHEGGIEMAQAVLPLTDRDEVKMLATTIVNGQTAEIDQMQQMLAERQGAPNKSQ